MIRIDRGGSSELIGARGVSSSNRTVATMLCLNSPNKGVVTVAGRTVNAELLYSKLATSIANASSICGLRERRMMLRVTS